MYYLGIDVGSSSIKVALIEAISGKKLISLHEPVNEMEILSYKANWAEQNPEIWWQHTCTAIKRAIEKTTVDASQIKGVGISYQMHGLVLVDSDGIPIRNSIIWCDSRAVEIGNKAFNDLGQEKCIQHLLNSPGNFTASKLKWVKDNEPDNYKRIYKFMLPGDFIAFKLTGNITTTKNGLSEGIFWDYKKDEIAKWLLDHYQIDSNLVPAIVQNFTNQGVVTKKAFQETGIPEGTPIKYRAGDQPNNALSLNILNHGEVAVTGGTSGVIYAVTNQLKSKESSRINHFAHVNYTKENTAIGKLLCVNGGGIQYSWLKKQFKEVSFEVMDQKASEIPVGSEGLTLFPFGNGAERMLNNKNVGTIFNNINLNIHNKSHLYRAALEGIAFSFVYGMEILKDDNVDINVIRAGNDNLFRSEIFANTLTSLIGHKIEIYDTTGAVGAARACGLSGGNFKKYGEDVLKNDYVKTYELLKNTQPYLDAYARWKKELEIILNNK